MKNEKPMHWLVVLLTGEGDNNEYVPIYEDKDGDWMLVGDVPWQLVPFYLYLSISPAN